MSNPNDSFFQEVEESVRADRYLAFAKKYGMAILFAIVALLAGVGGWRLYQGWEVSQSQQHSDSFMAAQKMVEAGDMRGAATAFEQMSKTGPKAYRAMAMMERAQTMEASGDLVGALAQFDAAAASSDPIMRDTARLRAAYLVAENQDFAAVQARVTPLITAGGPFSYLARELLGIEAWEAGQTDLARTTLQDLSVAFEAPEGVRQRAELALNVIGRAAPAAAPAAAAPAASPARPTGEPKQ